MITQTWYNVHIKLSVDYTGIKALSVVLQRSLSDGIVHARTDSFSQYDLAKCTTTCLVVGFPWHYFLLPRWGSGNSVDVWYQRGIDGSVPVEFFALSGELLPWSWKEKVSENPVSWISCSLVTLWCCFNHSQIPDSHSQINDCLNHMWWVIQCG